MRCVEAGGRRDRGAGPAARLHGTNASAVSAGAGGGPLRNRPSRRATAEEPALAPHWHPLLPLQRADGRPARAAVVGSATPRARPQPQLPRHTPPLTTVRAQQSACCCHAAALLAATRRPRPLSPFSRGWPYGALVASIFKSCMVLVQIGVSANYPPPAREARVCRENDTLSISRALSWSRCF